MKHTAKFTCFPRTEPPPQFVHDIVEAFQRCESTICAITLEKGLTSNAVLDVVRPRLKTLGFAIESGKQKEGKIHRPVFYGENGIPALNYQIDASPI